ncbi:cation:proton antiporter [Fructobacillus tropaeoli]|uniref:Na+/H+ antiporter n=1 Tax=Fructobacillus tropaeoli TaxID=709323 RepID=A0A3F3H3Y7_9LACO|nr:cation:proton antiporter [Fructobacillus tropaeoli]GAP04976.1 Na+/H+ antiporter [Fructobacillus tropaeoli]
MLNSIFILLVTVAISNVFEKNFQKIPGSYINITLGIILVIFPMTNKFILGFNAELFMLIIIAPLLFFEGQNTSNHVVRVELKSIIGTVLFLPIVTMVVLSVVLHWKFSLILPLAAMIVAVNIPTDATALSAVIGNKNISSRLNNTLKMESLFNDATGIVLLQAAILWLSAGKLLVIENSEHFVVSAVGGALFGGTAAFIIIIIRQIWIRSDINVISSQLLVYLLTPIIIYVVAEHIHISGIIAVVTAGLVHNSEAKRSRFSVPRQFHVSMQYINFISEILSNFVFVILGVTLCRIFLDQRNYALHNFNWLWVGISVYLVSLIARFFYALLSKYNGFDAIVFAFGGVHGAVTLSLTFSLLSESTSIVQSNYALILLSTTVVIILSMTVPAIVVRYILKLNDGEQKFDEDTKQKIKKNMVHQALLVVEEMKIETYVKGRVKYDLLDQISQTTLLDFVKEWRNQSRKMLFEKAEIKQEKQALMLAFKAEREYIKLLIHSKTISDELGYEIYGEILLSESLVIDPDNQFS